MDEGKLTTYLILGFIVLLWTLIKIGEKKPKVNYPQKTADTQREVQYRQEPQQQQPVHPVSRDNTEPQVVIRKSEKPHESAVHETTTDKTVSEIRDHFDVKKAVIYKELLEPKYKEY